ncbi:integral membrane family protein [Botryosphaeria dothidea]|uniref:Integral membrane family protein n=1 Tax=Botryosphaeria dothidea TaxID=55169 RepID=A0A8H4J3C3_9PEZI|nr:integral membrane family protein [Botryosphaeria dothidea]
MSSFDDIYKLNETQRVLRGVVIASLTITTAFVVLRCFIRVRLQSQFSIDDYLLVGALTALALQTSFGLYAMDYGGFGRKTSDLPRHVYLKGLKWLTITECTYTLAVMLAKLSIAFLQLRVMGLSTATLRRMHQISIGINLVVGLYEFLTLLFQCYPDPQGAYTSVLIASADCTDRAPVLVSVYVYSACNIALDWYYALAMVPLIWALQTMKPVVKVSAILILGMGLFASIATLVRLKYLVGFADSRDPLLAIVPVGLWSWVEECLGMCAACIATFRPLLRLIPGVRGASGSSGASPAGAGSGGDVMFVTWKSRLDGGRRAERARAERLGLQDLEGRSVVDGEEEEEEGGGGAGGGGKRASGGVDVGDGGSRGEASREGDDEHAFTAHRAETASVATTKSGTEVRTVADDAESQKSILQHKKSASGTRHSWRV